MIAISLSIVFVGCFVAIAVSVVYSIVNPQKTPPDAGLPTLQAVFALNSGPYFRCVLVETYQQDLIICTSEISTHISSHAHYPTQPRPIMRLSVL